MKSKVVIQEVENGYVVNLEGFARKNGEYVYSGVDGLRMLEDIGTEIWKRKIYIKD